MKTEKLVIDLATVARPPRRLLEPESVEDRQRRGLLGLTLLAVTLGTCSLTALSALDVCPAASVVLTFMALVQRDLVQLNLARDHRELVLALRRIWRQSFDRP